MIYAHYQRPSRCIQQKRIAFRKPGSPPLCLLSKSTKLPILVPVSIYAPHKKCQTPPFYALGLAAMYSHIQRKHLGLAFTCPYCTNKVFWNSCGWKSQMDRKHPKVPHCGISIPEEAAVAQEMLSTAQQVTSADAPHRSELAIPKAKKQNLQLVPLRPRTVPRTLLMVVIPVPLRMSLHLRLRPSPSPVNKQRLGSPPWSCIHLKKP